MALQADNRISDCNNFYVDYYGLYHIAITCHWINYMFRFNHFITAWQASEEVYNTLSLSPFMTNRLASREAYFTFSFNPIVTDWQASGKVYYTFRHCPFVTDWQTSGEHTAITMANKQQTANSRQRIITL